MVCCFMYIIYILKIAIGQILFASSSPGLLAAPPQQPLHRGRRAGTQDYVEILPSQLYRGLGDLMRHSCSPTPLNHWQAHKRVNELLLYLNGKPVLGENCLEIFLSMTVYLMTSGQLTLNIGFYPKDNIKCVKVACTRLLTSNCIINYLNYFSVFLFASRGKRVTYFTKLSAKHATECHV